MLLWSIEPKIDGNRLLPTIESKNLVAIIIMIVTRYLDLIVDNNRFQWIFGSIIHNRMIMT